MEADTYSYISSLLLEGVCDNVLSIDFSEPL